MCSHTKIDRPSTRATREGEGLLGNPRIDHARLDRSDCAADACYNANASQFSRARSCHPLRIVPRSNDANSPLSLVGPPLVPRRGRKKGHREGRGIRIRRATSAERARYLVLLRTEGRREERLIGVDAFRMPGLSRTLRGLSSRKWALSDLSGR